MTCLVSYLTGYMFDYLRTIVWLTAPYTVIRTRLFSNRALPPCRTGLSAGVCGLIQKNVILCIYIILRYDPGCTSYAVKYCIASPRPIILESLAPTTYPGKNGFVKWQQKRIPDSISYLETWSIAPDIWGRLPTAPSHVQAWSIAPVSGILICRRIKSDWINHLPPACWSTFWKSIFKQQLGTRCDIMDSISYLFFVFWLMLLYMSWYII